MGIFSVTHTHTHANPYPCTHGFFLYGCLGVDGSVLKLQGIHISVFAEMCDQ
ncbi:hypothetical protein BDZ97DRAFT_45811 [Flammula alnicola]|nr:hypothetical protein BDZ97DRAFT_45811 [Flammula alnicola]